MGSFSTKEIAAALYGSMAQEKLQTQKKLRKKLELENAITTASVLDKAAPMHTDRSAWSVKWRRVEWA
jgi:hypothetical protein